MTFTSPSSSLPHPWGSTFLDCRCPIDWPVEFLKWIMFSILTKEQICILTVCRCEFRWSCRHWHRAPAVATIHSQTLSHPSKWKLCSHWTLTPQSPRAPGTLFSVFWGKLSQCLSDWPGTNSQCGSDWPWTGSCLHGRFCPCALALNASDQTFMSPAGACDSSRGLFVLSGTPSVISSRPVFFLASTCPLSGQTTAPPPAFLLHVFPVAHANAIGDSCRKQKGGIFFWESLVFTNDHSISRVISWKNYLCPRLHFISLAS